MDACAIDLSVTLLQMALKTKLPPQSNEYEAPSMDCPPRLISVT